MAEGVSEGAYQVSTKVFYRKSTLFFSSLRMIETNLRDID